MIYISNFKKFYGSYLSLSINNLKLENGIHWVKGGNGAGKTTFFKSLAGLLPFEGDVIYDGTLSLRKYPLETRRYVNFGEAEPLYPAFITGRDIINLFINAKKAKAEEAKSIIIALGVDAFQDQSIGSYSSGMIKKLSLALAFIGNPKVILLDEPLITLDTIAVEIICSLIKNYHEKGVTFLISSHQAFEKGKLPINSILTVENHAVISEKYCYADI